MTSDVASLVDYYFIAGPKADDVVGSYRALTGAAPLFGKWRSAIGKAKTITVRRPSYSESRRRTGRCKFRSTASCRIGSTGE